VEPERRQLALSSGIIALVAFFAFGALLSSLTVLMLLAPGPWTDAVRRLKPSAQSDLRALGAAAVPLMLLVALACAGAAVGLWRRRRWGHRLAIGVLGVNVVGDLANGIFRHDWRTLIGLPIGGAMLIYLTRLRVRAQFWPPAKPPHAANQRGRAELRGPPSADGERRNVG
jgi:hypothetical protein